MNFKYQKNTSHGEFAITDFSDSSYFQFIKSNRYYKILWAKDANIVLSVDGYKLTVNKDCIIFCTPENMLEIPNDMAKNAIAFIFDREFYCIRDHDQEVSCNGLLFYGSSLPSEVKLSPLKLEIFNMYYVMFEEEFALKDSLQGEMLRTILKQILILSTRIIKENLHLTQFPTENIDLIRHYNLLVEKHFKTKHKVKDYADLLYKSPKTLTNIFNTQKYRNPSTIITDRIILEAQRLLLFSNKNVSEIAFELGFKSSSHFSKFIKKHTGESPMKFKEKLHSS